MPKGILAAIESAGINPPADASDAEWLRYGQLLDKEHYTQHDQDELARLIVRCKRSASDVHEDTAALAELKKCHACFNEGKCTRKIAHTIAAMEAHDQET